jgi:hypothetical protein
MYKVSDRVRIKHSFYAKRMWRVEKVLPSLKPGVMLYRVRLLRLDDTPTNIVIAVIGDQIREKIGVEGNDS